jgi:hypothetical protein
MNNLGISTLLAYWKWKERKLLCVCELYSQHCHVSSTM